MGRGGSYAEMGQDSAALADFETALRLDPHEANAYHGRGLIRARQGDLTGAVADFDQVIRLNSADIEAWIARATLHFRQGQAEAALADFAGLSSTIACECPKHLAQLLMRLTEFEDYSAQCVDLNPQDAALHQHLREITAQARHTFEQALERVALHEGLLPSP